MVKVKLSLVTIFVASIVQIVFAEHEDTPSGGNAQKLVSVSVGILAKVLQQLAQFLLTYLPQIADQIVMVLFQILPAIVDALVQCTPFILQLLSILIAECPVVEYPLDISVQEPFTNPSGIKIQQSQINPPGIVVQQPLNGKQHIVVKDSEQNVDGEDYIDFDITSLLQPSLQGFPLKYDEPVVFNSPAYMPNLTAESVKGPKDDLNKSVVNNITFTPNNSSRPDVSNDPTSLNSHRKKPEHSTEGHLNVPILESHKSRVSSDKIVPGTNPPSHNETFDHFHKDTWSDKVPFMHPRKEQADSTTTKQRSNVPKHELDKSKPVLELKKPQITQRKQAEQFNNPAENENKEPQEAVASNPKAKLPIIDEHTGLTHDTFQPILETVEPLEAATDPISINDKPMLNEIENPLDTTETPLDVNIPPLLIYESTFDEQLDDPTSPIPDLEVSKGSNEPNHDTVEPHHANLNESPLDVQPANSNIPTLDHQLSDMEDTLPGPEQPESSEEPHDSNSEDIDGNESISDLFEPATVDSNGDMDELGISPHDSEKPSEPILDKSENIDPVQDPMLPSLDSWIPLLDSPSLNNGPIDEAASEHGIPSLPSTPTGEKVEENPNPIDSQGTSPNDPILDNASVPSSVGSDEIDKNDVQDPSLLSVDDDGTDQGDHPFKTIKSDVFDTIIDHSKDLIQSPVDSLKQFVGELEDGKHNNLEQHGEELSHQDPEQKDGYQGDDGDSVQDEIEKLTKQRPAEGTDSLNNGNEEGDETENDDGGNDIHRKKKLNLGGTGLSNLATGFDNQIDHLLNKVNTHMTEGQDHLGDDNGVLRKKTPQNSNLGESLDEDQDNEDAQRRKKLVNTQDQTIADGQSNDDGDPYHGIKKVEPELNDNEQDVDDHQTDTSIERKKKPHMSKEEKAAKDFSMLNELSGHWMKIDDELDLPFLSDEALRKQRTVVA